MATKRRRDIRYGNDLYQEIMPPGAKKPLKVTYWDFWMADVLVREFDGDWDKLCDHFRAQKGGYSFQHYKAEALMNHLRLLRQTLNRVGLTVEDILAEADPDLLKKQHRKAKRSPRNGLPGSREKPLDDPHTQETARSAGDARILETLLVSYVSRYLKGMCSSIGVRSICPWKSCSRTSSS